MALLRRWGLPFLAVLVSLAVVSAVLLSNPLDFTGMLRQDPLSLEFVEPGASDPFFTLNNGTLKTVTFLVFNTREVTTDYVLSLEFSVTAGDADASAAPSAQLREYKGINRTLFATVNITWTTVGPLSWSAWTMANFTLGAFEPAEWELDLTFTFTGRGDLALHISALEP